MIVRACSRSFFGKALAGQGIRPATVRRTSVQATRSMSNTTFNKFAVSSMWPTLTSTQSYAVKAESEAKRGSSR
jgi:hypothetical protein